MEIGDPQLIELIKALGEVVEADLTAILSIESAKTLRVQAALGKLAHEGLERLIVPLENRPQLQKAMQGNVPSLQHHEEGTEHEPDTYEGVVHLPSDHSCLVVPLRWNGILLGVMTLDSAVCNAFRDDQLKAIKGFAQLIAKAIDTEKKAQQLTRQVKRLAVENASLRQIDGYHVELIGRSKPWLQVLETVKLASPTPVNILLTGETGTGKEQVARAIHLWSSRPSEPFVAVNCAVLHPELALSFLFGHEKGAFTGADRQHTGWFEVANGGTLFLDEIIELPLQAQAHLLRVLQERRFERVGGIKTISTDVRIITATHQNLEQAVQQGTFREDLYYRINTFPIHLPPLRTRTGDITLLALYLLKKMKEKFQMPQLTLSSSSLQELEAYNWPGNVRELGNVLERAAILASGNTILPQHLELQGTQTQQNQKTMWKNTQTEQQKNRENGYPKGYNIPKELPYLHKVISREILQALQETNGKLSGKNGAAQKLGLPSTTVASMIRRFSLRTR